MFLGYISQGLSFFLHPYYIEHWQEASLVRFCASSSRFSSSILSGYKVGIFIGNKIEDEEVEKEPNNQDTASACRIIFCITCIFDLWRITRG